MDAAHRIVARTFRQEADRILASLISSVKDFELAQDALQDALLVALESWHVDGIPHNPGAWITTTARRKAIDRLRRDSTLARKQMILQELFELAGQKARRLSYIRECTAYEVHRSLSDTSSYQRSPCTGGTAR